MTPIHLKPLPPHPLMPERYRNDGEKREWLRQIFDETANDYDRVESWLSLGSGRWHRRRALLRAGLEKGMRVADVACGTGLVAREAISIVGNSELIVGIDPSGGMLEHARRDLGIQTVLGVAESMPFESGRFDFLTMGYALRHVKDLSTAFAEFHRVLRPGGRLCILEITCPTGRIRQAVLRGYIGLLSHIVHILGPASPRTPELWSYYWWTIQQCVGPPRVAGALRDAGFENVEHRLELGLFSEYTARSPNFRNPSDPQVAPER